MTQNTLRTLKENALRYLSITQDPDVRTAIVVALDQLNTEGSFEQAENSPIILAALIGDLNSLEILMNNTSADINDWSVAVLECAAKANHPSVVHALIECPEIKAYFASKDLSIALFDAIIGRHNEVIETLLNTTDLMRKTKASGLPFDPVRAAIQSGRPDIVNTLLNTPSFASSISSISTTNDYIYDAAKHRQTDILDRLIQEPIILENSRFSLRKAIWENDFDTFQELLKVQPIAEGAQRSENFILQIAIGRNKPDFVRSLLQLPQVAASVNAANLRAALSHADKAIFQMLLTLPAVRSSFLNGTYLTRSNAVNHEQNTQIPSAGVDEPANTNPSNNPLALASANGQREIVQRLLSRQDPQMEEPNHSQQENDPSSSPRP